MSQFQNSFDIIKIVSGNQPVDPLQMALQTSRFQVVDSMVKVGDFGIDKQVGKRRQDGGQLGVKLREGFKRPIRFRNPHFNRDINAKGVWGRFFLGSVGAGRCF